MREERFPLWPDSGPDALAPARPDFPTLTLYPAPADVRTGAAMVVCPGGGYGGLADHEGEPVAQWLNALGITSLVLRYRIGPHSRHPMMLADAARAVQTVRARADDWDVDPARVGILGFSAGGHLASTLATHFTPGDPAAPDSIARFSSRPDAAVLIYPVITLQHPHAHLGSRRNLLGAAPPEDLIALLSNETQVTPETPPTFLVHSADDKSVPVENSLLFALALSRNGVPFALHVFPQSGHGYGLADSVSLLSAWPTLCAAWLRERGF